MSQKALEKEQLSVSPYLPINNTALKKRIQAQVLESFALSQTSIDILYIEDNADHARLTTLCLEENPNVGRCSHLTDGEKALDYLFRRGVYTNPLQSPRPDVILLDLRLPKVDGLEVLEKIKKTPQLNSIPVVIMSTSSAENDINKAYQKHANSYLVKPLDHNRFHEMINSFCNYWIQVTYQAGQTPKQSHN